MKHLLYVFAICSFLAGLFSCSEKQSQSPINSTETTVDSLEDNPFRLDSAHFADFYHQSDISKRVLSMDSTYWSISSVRERLMDSISSKNGVLYFGVTRTLLNGDLSVNFHLTSINYKKGDTITTHIGSHRFYQLLSAMKFVRNKMNHTPEVSTDLNFMENGQIDFGATYEPNDSTWYAGLVMQEKKGKGPSRRINLSVEKLDSMISKMDAMRTYLMK